MIKDKIKGLVGTYKFEIKDVKGKVRDTFEVKNLVTTVGFAQIALLAGSAGAVPFTYIAVGTSSTAVNISDTALTAETTTNGLERASGTVSRVDGTGTNDTYQITHTWTASGAVSVEEVGVFNAGSGGTMLSHALTGTKAVTAGETLTGTYQLEVA